MILHTGGFACADIRQRSRPLSYAIFNALSELMIPSCSPSAPITLISGKVISSFVRVSLVLFVAMVTHLRCKKMYVLNICRDFYTDLISRRRAEKRKTRTKNSAHNSSLFLYFARLLNINQARIAAGWKRNFSLLRHRLYHTRSHLSIVF